MKKLFALLMVSATLFAVACNNTEEAATEEAPATEEVMTEEAPAVEEAPATTDSAAAPAEATEAPAQ